MLSARRVASWLVLLIMMVGCNSSNLVKPKGRLLKGGEPFLPAEGEAVRIVFAPADAGTGTAQAFPAIFDADDGTFEVLGAQGTGLPPGQYRVAIEILRHKKDLLKGAFTPGNSPIIREVVRGSDIQAIDLDKPKG